MKKLFAFIIISVAVLGLCACGTTTKQNTTADTATEQQEATTPTTSEDSSSESQFVGNWVSNTPFNSEMTLNEDGTGAEDNVRITWQEIDDEKILITSEAGTEYERSDYAYLNEDGTLTYEKSFAMQNDNGTQTQYDSQTYTKSE